MAAKISNHSQTLTFISHPDHMQITLRTHTLPHTHSRTFVTLWQRAAPKWLLVPLR